MKNVRRFLQSLAVLGCVIAISPPVEAASTAWSGLGADSNWSTSGNWTNGVPTTITVNVFTNAGTTATFLTNNVVSASLTISNLTYNQSSGYHTTLINDGVTLAITNLATAVTPALQIGADVVHNTRTTNTITGLGGTLSITGNNPFVSGSANQLNFQVRQCASPADANHITLDMSGLGTLNAMVGKFTVGQGGTGNGQTNVSAKVNLARTNTVMTLRNTSLAVAIGDSSGGVFPQLGSELDLGITNALFFDTIAIGRGIATGNLVRFNSDFTNAFSPLLYLRGTNTASLATSRVSSLAIGDAATDTNLAFNVSGNVDLSGGTVDALVATTIVGEGSTNVNNTSLSQGTLTFNSGTFDSSNLKIGIQRATNAASVMAVVNVNDTGTLVSTNIELARAVGGPGVAQTAGTLNVNGGTVKVSGNITGFGGQSTNNLNSGLIDMQPAGAPSPGNILVGTFNVGATGTALVTNAGIIAASNSLVVAAGGTASGGGTALVVPSGATASVSGTITTASITLNNAATLSLAGSGSLFGSSNVSFASGAVLDASARSDASLILSRGQNLSGAGVVLGTLQIANGSSVAPGTATSIGTLANTGSTLLQGGGTMLVKVQNVTLGAGIGNDQLAVSANIGVEATPGGKFIIKLVSLDGTGTAGNVTNFDNTVSQTWIIASGTVTNFNASAFTVDASAFSNPLGSGQFFITTSNNNLAVLFKTSGSLAGQGPTISSPATDGSGHPTFAGFGIPGYVYGVESATSLGGPWTEAGNVTASGTGSWSFTDSNVVNPPIIFYRLYYPDNPGNPPQ